MAELKSQYYEVSPNLALRAYISVRSLTRNIRLATDGICKYWVCENRNKVVNMTKPNIELVEKLKVAIKS